jgi:hypothetical protein
MSFNAGRALLPGEGTLASAKGVEFQANVPLVGTFKVGRGAVCSLAYIHVVIALSGEPDHDPTSAWAPLVCRICVAYNLFA